MKMIIFTILFVLGALVVKGFDSVGPLIQTDNTEVKQDVCLDIEALEIVSNEVCQTGEQLLKSKRIQTTGMFIDNDNKFVCPIFGVSKIEYKPPVLSKIEINTTNGPTKITANSSGGLPYHSIVLS